MALGATVYSIDIDLADGDRGVYETLALRVARHPSESEEYLIARVLAYALEFTEGIAFSPGGLSDADAPAITVRDLTGTVQSWIEVGTPDAARLHRASKASPRVSVYAHKGVEKFRENLAGARIHRAADLEIYALDRALVDAMVARLARRMAFAMSVNERELFISIGDDNLTGAISRVVL